MGILKAMSEIPVSQQPFQYSGSPASFNFVKEGAVMGKNVAFGLAVGYALAVAAMMRLSSSYEPLELHPFATLVATLFDFYFGTVTMALMILVVGLIPAYLMGAIGGAAMGWVFGKITSPLSLRQALGYGFWVSLALMLFSLGGVALIRGIDHLGDDLAAPWFWMMWFAPNGIAFFGWWWVAYKLYQHPFRGKVHV